MTTRFFIAGNDLFCCENEYGWMYTKFEVPRSKRIQVATGSHVVHFELSLDTLLWGISAVIGPVDQFRIEKSTNIGHSDVAHIDGDLSDFTIRATYQVPQNNDDPKKKGGE